MRTLFKDCRTGLSLVQFTDAQRHPAKKRVSTRLREQRPAERIRRFWEEAFAEGRWDPWTQPPRTPGNAPTRQVARVVTIAEARSAFLESRAHRAANTRANYERGVPVPVVQRFAGHADVATTMRYCSLADDVYAVQVRAALWA
jgi:integrase